MCRILNEDMEMKSGISSDSSRLPCLRSTIAHKYHCACKLAIAHCEKTVCTLFKYQ